jgi:hypothetical protein
MASMPHPLVPLLLSLKTQPPKNPDELRKRLQSIRIRNNHETNRNQSWRNKQSYSEFSRWRGVNTPKPPQTIPHHQIVQPSSADASKQPTEAVKTSNYIPARYSSKFHNGSKKGDETILNTIILNKLNIFSSQTYNDVKQFLFQILGTEQKEFVREFTHLVFKKAASEEKYCTLYAKLLAEITEKYPVILDEIKTLHVKFLQVWDPNGNHEEIIHPKYRLGYSLFLSELFAMKILDTNSVYTTLSAIITSINNQMAHETSKESIEENMACLKRLCNMRVLETMREFIGSILLKDLENWICNSGKESPGISMKSKFASMDLKDLLSI